LLLSFVFTVINNTTQVHSMSDANAAFQVQGDVRGPWRRYLDALEPLRPDLYRYCRRLTGNIWDGEDLLQDALMRVFSLLGKIDADLENPRAYLIRTATNLWIDRVLREAREREALRSHGEPDAVATDAIADVHEAAKTLMESLPPKQRAALLLKDIFDLSLEETAALLKTTVGAVKSALHRGRDRLANADRPSANRYVPPRDLVEKFTKAMAANDLAALQALCLSDLNVELVGGAESEGFERARSFFGHAHFVMPEWGFGANPNWRVIEFDGEPMVLGFRTLDGVEGINEVHRLEVSDGKIARIRCYCFCPDTLRAIGEALGLPALRRRYRSPP
jgi:RNA polymerase sigma-70 factor (ECF subfamily)